MDRNYFRGEAQEVGQEVQLLIDDFAFEDRWDVERRLNVPAKHDGNPVVIADKPWEESVGGPSVLYDDEDGIFRMWYALGDSTAYAYQYRTSMWDPALHGYPYMVSYAESPDGLNWTKPLLKNSSYRGFE